MNLYHCMIELKKDARALAFASAAEIWMGELETRGLIGHWRLFRRKFGLASQAHSDFMLQIEVADLAQLDSAFRMLSEGAGDIDPRRYELMREMIDSVKVGLYRPYPDDAQREHIALI